MARKYITTAIDYPNAAPHMGHVLEKVLADVIARWWRLSGDEVRFQIGTDEHGSKIQRTAGKEGVTPQQLVDRNAKLFVELYDRLNVAHDEFIRTTDRQRHWPTVVALWGILRDEGMLEKRTYTGLYCSGCERFLTKKELVDGKCQDHLVEPEEVKEENWFYVLSKDQKFLEKLLNDPENGLKIIPEFRANETCALMERGLEDTSFSRPRTSVSWGIPVPDDEGQTMYVWCDALTNYISSLGFFTLQEDRTFWDDATVTHVIGKDIARFHALLWPSMLHHAGVKTPNHLLIHGFITNEGQKMSKSLGNVVDPSEVLARFGGDPDPLRFFLTHEIPVGNDGDFSAKRLEEMYDAKLRNQLGNLLNRILVLLKKEGGGIRVPGGGMGCASVDAAWRDVAGAMDAFELSRALQAVTALVDEMNRWMNEVQPWTLRGDERISALSAFAEQLRHVTLLLLPFLPLTAQRMARQLNLPEAEEMLKKDFVMTDGLKRWGGAKGWERVGEPEILFAPLQ